MKLVSEKMLTWRTIGAVLILLLAAEMTHIWLYGPKPASARTLVSTGATINLISLGLYILLVVLLLLKAFYILRKHRSGWIMQSCIALGLATFCVAQAVSMGFGAYDALTLKENTAVALSEGFGGDRLLFHENDLILETPDGIRWHNDIEDLTRVKVGKVTIRVDKSSHDNMSVTVYKNPGSKVVYAAYILLLLGILLWLRQVHLHLRLQNIKSNSNNLSS